MLGVGMMACAGVQMRRLCGRKELLKGPLFRVAIVFAVLEGHGTWSDYYGS
jgi:hypothetical protein